MVSYDILYALVKSQIIEGQHGFIMDRSTTTSLTIAVDVASQIDLVYEYFSKAFGILLRKLSF